MCDKLEKEMNKTVQQALRCLIEVNKGLEKRRDKLEKELECLKKPTCEPSEYEIKHGLAGK